MQNTKIFIHGNLYCSADIGLPQYAVGVAEVVQTMPPKLRPERFGQWEPYRARVNDATPEAIEKMWIPTPKVWAGGIDFVRSRPFVDVSAQWRRGGVPPIFNTVGVGVEKSVLSKEDDREVYLDTLRRLAAVIEADYGDVWQDGEPLPPKLLVDALWPVRWVNLYGPPYVEMIGRSKLLTCPAYSCQELEYGAIMVRATETLDEFLSPEGRTIARRIEEHIGGEYFDPGMAPRFRFPQAPPPPPPPDPEPLPETLIPDPDQFVRQAAAIAASLREHAPKQAAALDFSAASLEAVDRLLLRRSAAAKGNLSEHRELLRAAIAYYGEVVRRHCGGTWVVVEGDQREVAIQCPTPAGPSQELPLWTVAKLWYGREDRLTERFPLVIAGWRPSGS